MMLRLAHASTANFTCVLMTFFFFAAAMTSAGSAMFRLVPISLHTGPNAFFVLLPAICASLLRLTFLLSDFFCKWDVCLPNRNLHGSVSLDKPRVWKTSNKQLLTVLLALAGDLLLDIVVVVARVWDGLNSAFSLSTLALLFFCRRTLRPLPRT